MTKILQVGLQRVGSNYIKGLMKLNIKGVHFMNDERARSLPTHKHFRLYSEKEFIPTHNFLNNFHYESFSDFDAHVQRLLEEPDLLYQVIVKEPISWHSSISRAAAKRKWNSYHPKHLNPHFLIDYNLFYGKWLKFSQESERVFIYRYEDFLHDRNAALDRLKADLGLERKGSTYRNTDKVSMSKKFTRQRAAFYKKKQYVNQYSSHQLQMLREHLDKEVIRGLGYDLQADANS